MKAGLQPVRGERLSKGALEKLTLRLRESAEPSPKDLELLQQYKEEHWPTLLLVLSKLRGLPFAESAQFSAREKNNDTIIEKLEREKTQLRGMQDIVGVRAVISGGLREQRQAIREISRAFPPEMTRVSDRLSGEHQGYRALHIIVKQGRYECEVQVRTPYQNRWAQLFEGLGDRWGRDIRYMKEFPDADKTVEVKGAVVTRREVVQDMKYTSAGIAEAESFQEEIANAEVRLGVHADEFEERKREVEMRFNNVDSFFQALREVVPDKAPPPVQYVNATPEADERELFAFLVAFRRSKGQLLAAESFHSDDSELPQQRRRELEEKYRGDPDTEVVLLVSESLATIESTHSRYFKRLGELAAAPPAKVDGS
jgi:ppGpp synthetase/RelA/SpoT-type nucleotidyltranferase